MDLYDRIKIVIQLLIGYKVADNQEGVGVLLGYKNKSYFSQIINGKTPLPNKFLENLANLDNRISGKWLIHNQGLIESKQVYEAAPIIEISTDSTEKDGYIIELQRDKIKSLEKELQDQKQEVERLKKELSLASTYKRGNNYI